MNVSLFRARYAGDTGSVALRSPGQRRGPAVPGPGEPRAEAPTPATSSAAVISAVDNPALQSGAGGAAAHAFTRRYRLRRRAGCRASSASPCRRPNMAAPAARPCSQNSPSSCSSRSSASTSTVCRQDSRGWFSGLRDRHVGAALRLIHATPSEPLTLDSLARDVGLSRSAFAERFAHLVGVPPMHYLARWRLQLAANLLEGSGTSIAAAAAAVG